MSPHRLRPWPVAWAVLFAASAAVSVLMVSNPVIPSVVRDALEGFIAPGEAVWWLVLGGPFTTRPRTVGGIAFGAAANASLWWAVARGLWACGRMVLRKQSDAPRG